jgi:hypothetical protein
MAVRPRGFVSWRPNGHNIELLAQVQQVLDDYREHLPLTLRSFIAWSRTSIMKRPSSPISGWANYSPMLDAAKSSTWTRSVTTALWSALPSPSQMRASF